MTTDRTKLRVEKLKEEHKQTLSDLERLREMFVQAEIDPDADEGDPDLAEREKVMSLVQGLARKLEAIEHALAKAQQGLYGICEHCMNPINPERLEIVPEATLCVKCKAMLERQSRMGLAAARF
jgi:DnaK suppressor protein